MLQMRAEKWEEKREIYKINDMKKKWTLGIVKKCYCFFIICLLGKEKVKIKTVYLNMYFFINLLFKKVI